MYNNNNPDRMNTAAYKVGQAIALVGCICISAIVIALTVTGNLTALLLSLSPYVQTIMYSLDSMT